MIIENCNVKLEMKYLSHRDPLYPISDLNFEGIYRFVIDFIICIYIYIDYCAHVTNTTAHYTVENTNRKCLISWNRSKKQPRCKYFIIFLALHNILLKKCRNNLIRLHGKVIKSIEVSSLLYCKLIDNAINNIFTLSSH